ncbi:thioesterase II family protein [Streptomyces sp. NBC_01171]|uniref:thioesterase II family protein n=1 Tax=Streptomyces sp. NBC_01171 TaxID=2903757 RepID=UPI0038665B7F|nr:alpha/beta fold hydrolase [Streptomyces sp. NBC_01171]
MTSTAPDATHELWLHTVAERPDATHRLVCFPHAGGSASFFREWAAVPDCTVHAVRYPGRAERLAEPCATDLRALADDIARALLPLADRPLVLFGHSLGAAVALETARSLQGRGVGIAHLFASGSRNAPLPEPEPFTDDGEDDATVAARLVAMGGTDPELAADPFFQELVIPYVRADGRLFHSYAMDPGPLLTCPVTTIVGDADADADLRPWPELTSGPFRERTVRGGHFYLIDEPPYALVEQELAGAPRP